MQDRRNPKLGLHLYPAGNPCPGNNQPRFRRVFRRQMKGRSQTRKPGRGGGLSAWILRSRQKPASPSPVGPRASVQESRGVRLGGHPGSSGPTQVRTNADTLANHRLASGAGRGERDDRSGSLSPPAGYPHPGEGDPSQGVRDHPDLKTPSSRCGRDFLPCMTWSPTRRAVHSPRRCLRQDSVFGSGNSRRGVSNTLARIAVRR